MKKKDLKFLTKRKKKLSKRIRKLATLRQMEFEKLCSLRGQLHYETNPLVSDEAVKYLEENLVKVTIGYGLKLPNLNILGNLKGFHSRTKYSTETSEKQIKVLDMLIAKARVKHSRVKAELATLGLPHG